jgi:Helix-turn-helix domain
MNPQKLYTIREAREFTGLGVTAAYAQIKEGRLTAIRIGSRTFIRGYEIERYIASLPRIGGTQTNTPKRSLLLNLRTWIFLILECLKAILILHKLYVNFMSITNI